MEKTNCCLVSIAGDREMLLLSSQGRRTVAHLNQVRRFAVQVNAAAGVVAWCGLAMGQNERCAPLG